jgi:hypothetical protein
VVLVDDELRALRHRIKNDLQLVGGLIRLELAATSDATAQQALQAVDRRVLAITLSYANDAAGALDARAYLEELCRALPNVALTCEGDRTLATTTLTRVGIMLAEMCGTAAGGADVIVANDGPKLRIDVRRRTRGDAAGAWLSGFSRELVTSLSRQLRATFEEPDADRIVVTVEP